jgi:cysteine desulfuration protein SufE
MATIDELRADFETLDDWEDRYRYVLDLGRALPPMREEEQVEANRVRGCASQVWLVVEEQEDGKLHLRGQSDAHIVRGLVAVVLTIYSGKTRAEIAELDALGILKELGLSEHLSAQRANGLRAMIERIKTL